MNKLNTTFTSQDITVDLQDNFEMVLAAYDVYQKLAIEERLVSKRALSVNPTALCAAFKFAVFTAGENETRVPLHKLITDAINSILDKRLKMDGAHKTSKAMYEVFKKYGITNNESALNSCSLIFGKTIERTISIAGYSPDDGIILAPGLHWLNSPHIKLKDLGNGEMEITLNEKYKNMAEELITSCRDVMFEVRGEKLDDEVIINIIRGTILNTGIYG